MIIRKISRNIIARAPYEAWNAFVDILAMEEYSDLDEVQRVAHLAFWYDSEVQNGGHIQYFEYRGTDLLQETLQALHELGAECQRAILNAASQQYVSKEREPFETADSFVAAAREGEFNAFDLAYHSCKREMQELLEDYFQRHKDHFIEIV